MNPVVIVILMQSLLFALVSSFAPRLQEETLFTISIVFFSVAFFTSLYLVWCYRWIIIPWFKSSRWTKLICSMVNGFIQFGVIGSMLFASCRPCLGFISSSRYTNIYLLQILLPGTIGGLVGFLIYKYHERYHMVYYDLNLK